METYLDDMLRDDVILRQVRKLVAGLLQASRFRREADMVTAGQTLDDVLRDELGLSPAIVRGVASSTLLDMLSPGGVLDDQRAIVLGLLLGERARLSDAEGHGGEASVWRAKARALLEAAGATDVDSMLDDDDDALVRYAREIESGPPDRS